MTTTHELTNQTTKARVTVIDGSREEEPKQLAKLAEARHQG